MKESMHLRAVSGGICQDRMAGQDSKGPGSSTSDEGKRMPPAAADIFDYSQFFSLQQTSSAMTAMADVVGPLDRLAVDAIGRSETMPTEPIEIKFMRKGAEKRQLDIIPVAAVALYVFSNRFFEVLQKSGATGWSEYPVCLRSQQGTECPGYRGLAVHGRAGEIVDALSAPAFSLPLFPGCPAMPKLIGYNFEPETWDGQDVFFFTNTFMLVVTRRIADCISKEKFRGVEIKRIDLATRTDLAASQRLDEKGYFDACRAANDHRVLRDFL